MKYFAGIALFIVITACCAPVGLAQTYRTKKGGCPVPPPSPFKHSGKIVTTIDREGMRTTLQHPFVIGSEQSGIVMAASFIHLDPRRGIKPSVELFFFSAPMSLSRQDLSGLTLIADGQSVTGDGAVRFTSVSSKQGFPHGATRATLSYDAFISLLKSRKVAARLGMNEFALTNNHLEGLRELASLMAPTSKSWNVAEAR